MTMTADTQLEGPPVSWHTDPGPELTVVIPTKNERDNIAVLYRRLCATLQGLNWEAIFVDDDSDDGTPEIVRNLAGFKILIDLFASSPQGLRSRELPYTFSPRHAGESKMDSVVGLEYLMLLADKLVGHLVPIRFVIFIIVGSTGVISHLLALWILLRVFQLPFTASQSIATVLAMIGNFVLNNLVTYRDQRLSGFAFLKGLASFLAICSFGSVANVSIASFLYSDQRATWWLAGLAGAAMSAVWNYSVTSVLTWGTR
jgi:dolichol-phosphate mannosyltransferase